MSPDVVGPAVVGGAVVLVAEGNLAHGMTYYSAITEIVIVLHVWVITLWFGNGQRRLGRVAWSWRGMYAFEP